MFGKQLPFLNSISQGAEIARLQQNGIKILLSFNKDEIKQLQVAPVQQELKIC